jgi:hypothetical protein
MAVTAQDKQYLNQEGISALQAATDAWNKAYAAGDQAGMDAASTTGKQIRQSNNFLNTPGSGYNVNQDGTYINPSGSASQPGVTANNTNYAAQIISLLTAGGVFDRNQLNALVMARNNKVSSDPQLYGQFETTQSILDKYLPGALESENKFLNEQEQKKQSDQIGTIAGLLQALAGSSNNYMSYDDARSRASNELGPQYENAATVLKNSINKDLEQRGIYNSPLGAGIYAEKQGALSNDQISAIATRANQLIQDDRTLTLQEKQLQSDTLQGLLNSLIGRESSIADLTGYYNGVPTFDREQFNTQTGLNEGQLTGIYNGSPTLEARNSAIDNALNSVQTMGYVSTQEQADLLGVPVGTPSAQAAQAAAQLKLSYSSMYNSNKNNKVNLSDFTKDMAIWEATGKAPNTPAMQYYGITPGTPWSEDAKAKLEEMTAQQEIDHMTTVSNFARTYGIDSGTAEAALLAIGNSSSLSEATTLINNQSAALAAEGVSANRVISAMTSWYQNTVRGNRPGGNSNTGTDDVWNTVSTHYNTKEITDPSTVKYLDGQADKGVLTKDGRLSTEVSGRWYAYHNGSWYEATFKG